MLYPQNGDRILATDSMTSFRPMYDEPLVTFQLTSARHCILMRCVRYSTAPAISCRWDALRALFRARLNNIITARNTPQFLRTRYNRLQTTAATNKQVRSTVWLRIVVNNMAL